MWCKSTLSLSPFIAVQSSLNSYQYPVRADKETPTFIVHHQHNQLPLFGYLCTSPRLLRRPSSEYPSPIQQSIKLAESLVRLPSHQHCRRLYRKVSIANTVLSSGKVNGILHYPTLPWLPIPTILARLVTPTSNPLILRSFDLRLIRKQSTSLNHPFNSTIPALIQDFGLSSSNTLRPLRPAHIPQE